MATSIIGSITSEQFLALPQQFDAIGNRVKQELIAGEIVQVPFPSKKHDVLKNRINRSLTLFLASRTELELGAYVELGFEVAEHDSFAPDVSVIRERRLSESGPRAVLGAPEIAIEVVSPSETAAHLRSKTSAYLANGARAVWVVYPEEKLIEVHTANGMRAPKDDQPIQDELLPGFSEPVSNFFTGL